MTHRLTGVTCGDEDMADRRTGIGFWCLVGALVATVSPANLAPTSTARAVTGGATDPTPAPATRSSAAAAPHFDLAGARVVDLSHAYDADTLFWPANPPETFQLSPLFHGRTPGGFFY